MGATSANTGKTSVAHMAAKNFFMEFSIDFMLFYHKAVKNKSVFAIDLTRRVLLGCNP
jgi:hypothetical protein